MYIIHVVIGLKSTIRSDAYCLQLLDAKLKFPSKPASPLYSHICFIVTVILDSSSFYAFNLTLVISNWNIFSARYLKSFSQLYIFVLLTSYLTIRNMLWNSHDQPQLICSGPQFTSNRCWTAVRPQIVYALRSYILIKVATEPDNTILCTILNFVLKADSITLIVQLLSLLKATTGIFFAQEALQILPFFFCWIIFLTALFIVKYHRLADSVARSKISINIFIKIERVPFLLTCFLVHGIKRTNGNPRFSSTWFLEHLIINNKAQHTFHVPTWLA